MDLKNLIKKLEQGQEVLIKNPPTDLSAELVLQPYAYSRFDYRGEAVVFLKSLKFTAEQEKLISTYRFTKMSPRMWARQFGGSHLSPPHYFCLELYLDKTSTRMKLVYKNQNLIVAEDSSLKVLLAAYGQFVYEKSGQMRF